MYLNAECTYLLRVLQKLTGYHLFVLQSLQSLLELVQLAYKPRASYAAVHYCARMHVCISRALGYRTCDLPLH